MENKDLRSSENDINKEDEISTAKQQLHEYLQKRHLRLPNYKRYDHSQGGYGCVLSFMGGHKYESLCFRTDTGFVRVRDAEHSVAKKALRYLQKSEPTEPIDIKVNYKGKLQTYCMKMNLQMPIYRSVNISKHKDEPNWECTLFVELNGVSRVIKATGVRKKDTEQTVAKRALNDCILQDLGEMSNPKGHLLQLVEKYKLDTPIYSCSHSGPLHKLEWECCVTMKSLDISIKSKGSSKLQSEERCARIVISIILSKMEWDEGVSFKDEFKQQIVNEQTNDINVKNGDEERVSFKGHDLNNIKSVSFDEYRNSNVNEVNLNNSDDSDIYIIDSEGSDEIGDELLF